MRIKSSKQRNRFLSDRESTHTITYQDAGLCQTESEVTGRHQFRPPSYYAIQWLRHVYVKYRRKAALFVTTSCGSVCLRSQSTCLQSDLGSSVTAAAHSRPNSPPTCARLSISEESMNSKLRSLLNHFTSPTISQDAKQQYRFVFVRGLKSTQQ